MSEATQKALTRVFQLHSKWRRVTATTRPRAAWNEFSIIRQHFSTRLSTPIAAMAVGTSSRGTVTSHDATWPRGSNS